MTLKQVRELLNDYDKAVKIIQNRVLELGSTEVMKRTGIDKTELSKFANGNRVFSRKRIEKIIVKIFE